MIVGRAGRLRDSQWGGSGDRRIQSFPAKRVCSEDGCATVLSIYNSAVFCFVHEPRGRTVVKHAL